MERYIIGAKIEEIETPALLLDLDKVEYNLTRMANFLEEHNCNIRPHFKTHKSPFLAHQQIAAGAIGMTCQKLSEAEVLGRSGITDILITNQIIGSQKIKRLVNLAAYTDLKVAVDNKDNAARISKAALAKGVVISVLIEVNIGMDRCGVEPGRETLALAHRIKDLEGLKFMGIMAYEGHTVFIESLKEREEKVITALQKVSASIQLLKESGIDCAIVSCGGTGTYMITAAYPEVTEIEAGSYLTMDTKYNLVEGVKGEFKQALSLLTTIVSKPALDRIIIDSGMKAISKENGIPKIKDEFLGAELYKLSEEHGFIQLARSKDSEYLAGMEVGNKIELIPSHGCTTINLHDTYYGVRAGIVECILPIEARGMFY